MEKEPEPPAPSCSTPSHPPATEDDFQFVLCERCRQESPNLKLLTCLHTLCLGCLSENKPVGQCPICHTPIPQANGIPDMDNLLFINLQARLKVYKKIRDSEGPSCSRCRGQVAAVWCSECEEFLCTKCFEDHQWFFKKRSHEARRVEDLRAESAHQFLEDTKKSSNLFCSRPGHADQGHISSIYCRRCAKALCCSCALLDSQHAPFCDIRSESQRRQQELGSLGRQLRGSRSGFQAAAEALRAQAARLEEAQREMRELIRQRAEQLVALIRREEEELLALVAARQEQGRGRLAGELRRVEGVLRRLEAGERLVEKMGLYGTEQEVMDMQPFIKGSLQELQRLQPPAAQEPAQPGHFAECRARLQALVERVTGRPGPSAAQHDSMSDDDTTLILDLQPPREHCQPDGGLPTGLPAHHQPSAPTLDLSNDRGCAWPDQGEVLPPAQPTSPSLLMQRAEEAEEDSRSARGDNGPLPRSIQEFLASLKEDFSGWARSNRQQAEQLLRLGDELLQAQQRANRHLVSMIQEIQAISHSLATVTSAMAPLPQPVASQQDLLSPDVAWPSLPSDLLELFPSSTPQNHQLLVPVAATAPSPSSPRPATPPASPSCSEPSSPASEGEQPKSRYLTRGKRRGKAKSRAQKRRKK